MTEQLTRHLLDHPRRGSQSLTTLSRRNTGDIRLQDPTKIVRHWLPSHPPRLCPYLIRMPFARPCIRRQLLFLVPIACHISPETAIRERP